MTNVTTPVADLDLAALDQDELERQICRFAGRRAAEECAWLLLIGEFDRREAWGPWECRSTAGWLSWHCGLSPHAGRERVRVARALESLPRVRAEFATGQLTYSKVRAITRVATKRTERSLVSLGLAATAAQLERICAGYRSTQPVDEEAAVAERDGRVEVRTWHDDHGLFHLEAVLQPEDGALVAAALAAEVEHLRDQQRAATAADAHVTDGACSSSVPAGTPHRRRADALIRIIQAFLSNTQISPTVERRHLVAHVDVGPLTATGQLGIDPEGRCTLNGRRLTPDTARHLGVDTALTTILIDHRGLPLSVGRRSRTATPAIRLALDIRHREHCGFIGCASTHVEAHHLTEWQHGGQTDLDAMVWLCWFHHHRLHQAGYQLTLDPTTNTAIVTRPDGITVQTLTTNPIEPARLIEPDEIQPPPPGEAGTRLDLGHIVGCLAEEDEIGCRHDDAA